MNTKYSNFWLNGRHFVFGDWDQNRQILIYSLMRVKMTPGVKLWSEFTSLFLLFRKTYSYSFGGVKFTPNGVKVKMHTIE